MTELIIIKTNQSEKVKKLLEEKKISYEIYQEPQKDKRICFYCSKKVVSETPATIKIEENNYLIHSHCFKEIEKNQKANQAFVEEWGNFGIVCGESYWENKSKGRG